MMSSKSSILSRNSNIELLRLICMLMIAIHHFIMQPSHGLLSSGMESYAAWLVNDLCYIGVNCFVLISGWFGIRVSWKGIWQLFFFCAFYGLASYLFHIWHTGAHIGSSLLTICILPFSHSQWWFINCYLILYLSAPLINKAIEALSKAQYMMALILFTVMNVYFGNIMHTPFFNLDGYSAAQFIYIYLIGGYMSRYVNMEWVKQHKLTMLIGYIICCTLYFSIRLLPEHFKFDLIHLGYNNPLNIGGAIFFFLFMVSYQFKSKTINYISGSALAIYLIQESKYFGHEWLYPYIGQQDYNLPQILLLSVVFMVACIAVDQLRRLAAMPLNRLVGEAVDKFPNCLKEIEHKL